jgi:hypothetical protein
VDKKLSKLLEVDYAQAVKSRARNQARAEKARREGVMPAYFDRMRHVRFPDICWALEKWDEARQEYRRNAQLMVEERAWHAEHSGADYPLDESSDRRAACVVKAGDLKAAPEELERAVAYWKKQKPHDLVLTHVGLHAAQAGVSGLAKHAKAVVAARQELPGGRGKNAQRARELLHYEPAQVSLMLGRRDEFEDGLKSFEEGARLVEGKPGLAFPEPLQGALVAAARGLRALAGLRAGGVEPEAGREAARAAFEESMLGFYRFEEGVDWNLYFMRLNTRFADELAAGETPNPNPFADGWSL